MANQGSLVENINVREYTNGRTAVVECHGTTFAIQFSPGRYGGFTESYLAAQLSDALGRLMASRERARIAALAEATGGEVVDPSLADPDTRQFHKVETGLVAQGGGGDVRVRTKGKLQWKVDIAEGALARLSQGEFESRFTAAVLDALRDFTLQRAAAKRDVLGVDFMHMADAAKAAIEGRDGQNGDR